MLTRSTSLLLLLAALLAAAPGYGMEITSDTHPSLRRALAANPEFDTGKDGLLDLAEYSAQREKLLKNRDKKLKPPHPYLAVRENGDIVVAGFEDNNLRNLQQQGWKIEGNAFPNDLQTGTRILKRRVGPCEGKYLLTTFLNSGKTTGRLTSGEFLLEQDFLKVVMSGGNFPHRIAVTLHVDGEAVRSATGNNDDYFETVAFDLREFAGRPARVEIVDNHRGLWGHINLDSILLSTEPGEARIISVKPTAPRPRGVVHTPAGLRHGAIELLDGFLRVDGTPVSPDDLLLAFESRDADQQQIQGMVRLVDGESWTATIRGLESGKVTISNPLFGERAVPLDKIASLEFEASAADAEREPGHLYRSGGEPIPGKLVWIRDKDIAIDCPLGIIPVPRESVQRFVLANPAPVASPLQDEIALTDGSRFFGRTSFVEDKLVVTHDTLGELRFSWTAVRYLRRAHPGVTWLDQARTTVVERIGPALPPPAPAILETGQDDHIRTLRLMPRTVLRIDLPSGPHSRILRAALTPLPGCRGTMTVRFRSGDTTFHQQAVAPDAEAVPLALDIPGEGPVTIEVDFAGPLAFPSGIDLRDAHVVTVPSNSNPAEQN